MRTRLGLVMFLEYAVQGLWSVPLAAFLMGSPHEGGLNMPAGPVALIYATMAVGATVTPLLIGLLCDRLFAVQRMLALLHFVGAGLLAGMLWWSMQCASAVQDTFNDLSTKEMVYVGFGTNINLSWAILAKEQLVNPPDEAEFVRYHHLKKWLGFVGVEYKMPIRLLSSFFGDPYPWGPNQPRLTPEQQIEALDAGVKEGVRRIRENPEIAAAADRAFPPLFTLMLAYACVYLPTITLSNVVCFRNLPDPARQYGPFRALGTLGWIAAGLFVGYAAPAVSPLCFLFAAVASAVLAALCLFLPNTPPLGKPKSAADALGLPALKLLADRPFLVYVLTAFVASALMPFHNVYTNKFLVDLHVDHPAAVQTLAQPTEILGAILIPWFWRRLGTRWMLTLGLVASAGRFFAFAGESAPVVIGLGLPLHGIGFAMFYIVGAMFVDREAPSDLRASAQGIVMVIYLGLGGMVGTWFAGRVVESYTSGGVVDWHAVWLVPAVGTLMAGVGFAMLFRERSPAVQPRLRGLSREAGNRPAVYGG
jgi:nucleoside transporter